MQTTLLPAAWAAITDNGERVTHLYPNSCFTAHLALYHFALPWAVGKTVLDAGCGTGYGAHYLAEQGAACVQAIDLSDKAIGFCQQHFQRANLHYQVMDLQAMRGFAPHSFDLIFTSNTLEHLPDVGLFFQQAHQLLKPEGVIIVAVPPIVNEAARLANLANPYHLNIWSPRQWHHTLEQFFAQVACYRHHFAPAVDRPGALFNVFDTPAEAMPIEDFCFLPIELAELSIIGAITAIFVAQKPRSLAQLPIIQELQHFVDHSFSRSLSLSITASIPAPTMPIKAWSTHDPLAKKFVYALRHYGLQATMHEIVAYLRWRVYH